MGRFGVVGVVNTVLTLAVIYVLHSWMGTAFVYANAIGFAAGFANSFFMNRYWTFSSKGNLFRESILFVLVFFASYLAQLFIVLSLKDFFLVPVALAQIAGMAVYTLTNYLGNRMVTFRKKQDQQTSAWRQQ